MAPNSFTLHKDTPYAELWMGTHKCVPACDLRTGQVLSELISYSQDPNGVQPGNLMEGNLPFILKVLSIGKALCIQAHPDKSLAEELHAKNSHIYPDNNHKPEMVIALSAFEAFCGFRPADEILYLFKTIPPLTHLLNRLSFNLQSAFEFPGYTE
ncbi:Phosphomannose isomerase [Hyphodiscus hymeniophilus]|uniref:Phosphomannose isomerase n=1 Tax=Hyphodiscus hymeniophilus TaxID=353542 RepID=A0A9P6VIQ0_9HELO|nr:Phosphomannose isomerase [Hyphodiscus hymeniophilus]